MRLLLAVVLPWTVLLASRVPLVGEPIGVAMPLLGGLAAISALRTHRRRAGPGGRPSARVVARASLALACVAGTIAPWVPLDRPVPTDPITVLTANLLAGNDNEESTRQLQEAAADVLVTIETPWHALERLADRYPYRLSAPPKPLGGVNVWSRFPLTRLPVLDGTADASTVVALVDAPTPFRIVAAHLPRPWVVSGGLPDTGTGTRYEAGLLTHHRLIAALAEGLAETPGPVVLAGDLNLTDRGHGYWLLTGVLDDAVRTTWGSASSRKPLFLPLRLRIDHILVGGGLCGASLPRVPLAGSDHEGVAASVGPCP